MNALGRKLVGIRLVNEREVKLTFDDDTDIVVWAEVKNADGKDGNAYATITVLELK